MLLKFKRDNLLKPLQLVTGFVEKKQTMPILSNVYIKKEGNKLILIANDLEIQACITVSSSAFDGNDFIITIPGKKLLDILKALPENVDVIIEQKDSKVLLVAGTAKFSIQCLPASHYPLLKVTDEIIAQFSISQKTLKRLIWQIQYAMAEKDSRVFLNGMYFEVKNKKLNLISTDAHRLGFVTTDIDTTIDNASAIIPRKSIIELFRLLDEESQEVINVKFSNNQVVFETKDKQLVTKIIDGKYPEYERVIPISNDKLCLINRQDLQQAVERVGVIGIDKLKSLVITINNNKMNIICTNEDQEESSDEIVVNYQYDNPLKFNFNINYVKDLLSNSDHDVLQLAFSESGKSVLITVPDDTNFKAVLMPIRA